MDQEIKDKLNEQALKIEAIYVSVEKLRKFFLVTLWVTILAIVLPMIGIGVLAPSFVNSYTSILNDNQ